MWKRVHAHFPVDGGERERRKQRRESQKKKKRGSERAGCVTEKFASRPSLNSGQVVQILSRKR